MSTRTTFDLTGLSRAIQGRDSRYHLALYAPDAEVEIFDRSKPDAPLEVLRGKPAIAAWLQRRSSAAVHDEVKEATVQPDRVAYTEECRYGDGSSVLVECDAEVRRGQITHAAVTLVHVPPHEPSAQPAHPAAPTTADRAPRQAPRGQSSGRPGSARQLPGNFLG
jgi:hypothetical protein